MGGLDLAANVIMLRPQKIIYCISSPPASDLYPSHWLIYIEKEKRKSYAVKIISEKKLRLG